MQLRVAQIQMHPTRRSRLVLRGRLVQARMFQMRPNRQQRREARAKEPWAQAWRCQTHPSSQWRFEARERGWRHRKRPIPR